jgi:hypothetical protein
MGNDIDDALALDMLYKYMDAGKVDLLAVCVNKEGYGPVEYVDMMNTWYGYPPEVEYIIDSADTYEYETYTGYTPVHELRMKDGLLLSTIHIRDDVLQERFDGVYPEYNVP